MQWRDGLVHRVENTSAEHKHECASPSQLDQCPCGQKDASARNHAAKTKAGKDIKTELQTTIHTPASGRLSLVRLFIQHCSNISRRPRRPFELLLQVADSSIEPFQCAIHHLL